MFSLVTNAQEQTEQTRMQGVSWGNACSLGKVSGKGLPEEVILSEDLKEMMGGAMGTNQPTHSRQKEK